jgi:hypothetical protein
MFSGRVNSFCSTSGTRRVNLVTKSFVLFLLSIVLSVLLRFMDSDYPFGIFKLFLDNKIGFNSTVCFLSQKPLTSTHGQPSHGGDCKTFVVMTST